MEGGDGRMEGKGFANAKILAGCVWVEGLPLLSFAFRYKDIFVRTVVQKGTKGTTNTYNTVVM